MYLDLRNIEITDKSPFNFVLNSDVLVISNNNISLGYISVYIDRYLLSYSVNFKWLLLKYLWKKGNFYRFGPSMYIHLSKEIKVALPIKNKTNEK